MYTCKAEQEQITKKKEEEEEEQVETGRTSEGLRGWKKRRQPELETECKEQQEQSQMRGLMKSSEHKERQEEENCQTTSKHINEWDERWERTLSDDFTCVRQWEWALASQHSRVGKPARVYCWAPLTLALSNKLSIFGSMLRQRGKVFKFKPDFRTSSGTLSVRTLQIFLRVF